MNEGFKVNEGFVVNEGFMVNETMPQKQIPVDKVQSLP